MATLQLGNQTIFTQSGSNSPVMDSGVDLSSTLKYPSGFILRVLQSVKDDIDTITSVMPSWVDIAGTDQDGNGSVWCLKITPMYQNSKFFITASGNVGMNGAVGGFLRLVRDSTPIYVGAAASGYHSVSTPTFYGGSADGNNNEAWHIQYIDSPNTTSEITYKLQGACQGGIMKINGLGNDNSGQTYSGRSASNIIVMEIVG